MSKTPIRNQPRLPDAPAASSGSHTTLLHLLPPRHLRLARPARTEIHEIAVFPFSPDRPLDPSCADRINGGSDVWVIGPCHTRVQAIHSTWLSESELETVSLLGMGKAWMRAGERTVVVDVATNGLRLPLSWSYAYDSARRRSRVAPGQLSAALMTHAPQRGISTELYGQVADKENLLSAWFRVAQARRESRGSDGVTIDQFRRNLDAEIQRLAEELAAQRYQQRPARRVVMPKPDGGQRVLNIPCVRDRVVQTSALAVLEQIFEPTFHPASFGFRPRRGAHQAIAMARTLVSSGLGWAVTADIQKCFDTIDHEVLLGLVARRIADPFLMALLRHWLSSDMMVFGELLPSDLGVPQGNPLSPLLSNVYLDPLDQHLSDRRLHFVRYADDLLIFGPTESEAVGALETLEAFLGEPLHLSVKPAKTNIGRLDDGVDFLGFRLFTNDLEIQLARKQRFEQAIRGLIDALALPRATLLERSRTLFHFNGLVRGFRNYFSVLARGTTVGLRELDE